MHEPLAGGRGLPSLACLLCLLCLAYVVGRSRALAQDQAGMMRCRLAVVTRPVAFKFLEIAAAGNTIVYSAAANEASRACG